VDVRRRQQPFSPETLAERLQGLPPLARYWLAYSGGCDSHVLLHAAVRLRQDGHLPAVHAVHVDHGLQAASAAWAQHCAAVCAELAIPFTLLRVDARAERGESPEAAARHARYHAIAALMEEGDCLLTAHHQDDQAETLLLQLLRGGGPHGLAGMPALSLFGAGLHARPLLAFARDDLRQYAQQHSLQWIEDPSNVDQGFDRNYLRNEVMPLLRERWPAVGRVLARGAVHQAEAAQLLDGLAAQDLRLCQDEDNSLRITVLTSLNEVRQRNVLRYWLKHLGFDLPDSVRLAHLQQQVLHAAPDRSPMVYWPGVTVRRYRDRLYALPPLSVVDSQMVLPWDMQQPLRLSEDVTLIAVTTYGDGVKASLCQHHPVTVRYRQGGEECQPAPRAATRPLKKMLQEIGVPPWERDRIPLIYVGECLAAVAGYWVCSPCQAGDDEEGIRFQLRHADEETR
jgi:tRNA(Ile)-lysidine synthase